MPVLRKQSYDTNCIAGLPKYCKQPRALNYGCLLHWLVGDLTSAHGLLLLRAVLCSDECTHDSLIWFQKVPRSAESALVLTIFTTIT